MIPPLPEGALPGIRPAMFAPTARRYGAGRVAVGSPRPVLTAAVLPLTADSRVQRPEPVSANVMEALEIHAGLSLAIERDQGGLDPHATPQRRRKRPGGV